MKNANCANVIEVESLKTFCFLHFLRHKIIIINIKLWIKVNLSKCSLNNSHTECWMPNADCALCTHFRFSFVLIFGRNFYINVYIVLVFFLVNNSLKSIQFATESFQQTAMCNIFINILFETCSGHRHQTVRTSIKFTIVKKLLSSILGQRITFGVNSW